MWCAHCHTEVAAEVAGDNRRIHCASCGQEIASTRPRKPLSTTQEARELLERWSNERIVDPYGPLRKSTGIAVDTAPTEPHPAASSTETAETAAPPKPPTEKPDTARRLRIDGSHSGPPAPTQPATADTPADGTTVTKKPDMPSATIDLATARDSSESKRTFRVHQAHATPAPHFDISKTNESTEPRTINWMAVAGQWLSYVGILALTAGTGLVLLGHFRGPDSYVPTGWLVTMAGQMLLFLGVMTTFSTGMEKTTDTVSRKIDDLGDRIIRMEEAARELRQLNAPPANETDASQAESA